MRSYSIQFIHHDSVKSLIEDENGFMLRPERGWVWLQKLCIRFLKWRRCFFWGGKVEIQRVHVDPAGFIENLFTGVDEITVLFNRKPNVLLIGLDDYRGLMRDRSIPPFAFDFDAEYGFDGKILGLKVKVIPWMGGILPVCL